MHCVSWAVKQVCPLLFGAVWGWWLCSHSREMLSCFWHPEDSRLLWTLCIQDFSCFPCSPSITRFLTMSLMPETQTELLLCCWNLQMWKYHRTWARDWYIIIGDWSGLNEHLQVVHLKEQQGCVAGPCVLAGMWPETGLSHAVAGFSHGMLTSPPGALCGGCAGAEGQSPARED